MPSIRKIKKRLKAEIRKLEAEIASLDESFLSTAKRFAKVWLIAYVEIEIERLNLKRRNKQYLIPKSKFYGRN